MASFDGYNRWIVGLFEGFYGHRILDVGSSIGNTVEIILNAEKPELMVSIDISAAAVGMLAERLAQFSDFRAYAYDIQSEGVLSLKPNAFDTVTCFNVLEHIRDENRALNNMHELLDDDGRLLLYVPAIQWIYGTLDENDGHFRRYGKNGLEKTVTKAGFTVEKLQYSNLPGVFTWLLYGKLLKRQTFPSARNLRLADLFIKPIRAFESICPMPIGQSLVCVCRKTK